jgi:hypothetical protein
MEERMDIPMKEDKLEKIDGKLNMLFEELISLERRLEDKRMQEQEENLKREEDELRCKRENLMIERTIIRESFESKYENFKKGYYW